MRTQRRLVITGAALMMIGSICPWATVFGFFPVNGLQCRFGWGTLLIGGLLVTLEAQPTWLGRPLAPVVRHERLVKLGASGVAIALCVLVILGFSGGGAVLQTDWGLYLTLIAAVAVVWATLRRVS